MSHGADEGGVVRALIVEDHELLAASLVLALADRGVTADRVAHVDAILSTAARFRPDVVLLDLHLGRGTDTRHLVPTLRSAGSSVVMVTAETDPAVLGACVEAGADGIVGKDRPLEELVEIVEAAAGGGRVLSPTRRHFLLDALRRRRQEEMARQAPFRSLTPRERAVLASLVDGKAPEQIARDSFVAVSTVRSQVKTLLQKLGVHSQLAAVALARQHQWSDVA